MCFFPFAHLWACCCERKKVYYDPEGGKGKGREHHKHRRNTRARLATNSTTDFYRTKARSSDSRRRRSSGSTGGEKGRRSSTTTTSGEKHRSRDYADASSTHHRRRSTAMIDGEPRKRRRSSGGGTEGRAAAERALNGRSGLTAPASTESKRRRRGTNLSLDRSGGVGETYLIAEKRNSVRRNSAQTIHDDSGYRTEEKKQRPSGRRVSKTTATATVAAPNIVIVSATDFDYSPKYMDGTTAPPAAEQPVSILRKPGHQRKRSDDSGAAVRLDHSPHFSDEQQPPPATKKPSRSKSTREPRRTAAMIAAEATQTSGGGGNGGEVPRRRSTRKKPIRIEDVDMTYRDPDVLTPDDELYIASDDTYADGTQEPRRATLRKRAASGSTPNSRSKSHRESAQSKVSTGSPELPARKRSTRTTATDAPATTTRTRSQRKQKLTQVLADTNAAPQLLRQQVQAPIPRSRRTEFSLSNLEQLAAEGLKQRPTLHRGPAYVPTIVPASEKPSFTYREDGPFPSSEADHHAALTTHIAAKGLQSIIPPSHPRPREIAKAASLYAPAICRSLYLSRFATPDLAKLGLYDVVVFCDDSSSMHREERYGTLKTVVRRIARISSSYNPSGIKIRFINATNDGGFNGIVTEEQVETCLDAVTLGQGTALGTSLFSKVVQPMIVEKAKRGELTRPVIVSVVTDGEPTGEHADTLKRTILATKNELSKLSTPNRGKYAVVFQIARVGMSASAKRYVKSLARDPEVKDLVFCTDESLDWALGEAEDAGQLNTWLTQVLAASIKR